MPEFSKATDIKLVGSKLFDEVDEALKLGINAKAVITGPYTLLKLSRFIDGPTPKDFVDALISAYSDVIKHLNQQGVAWIQIDEPALSFDVDSAEKTIFDKLYKGILASKGSAKILLQNYFGDIRDVYNDVTSLDFDGIGLDLLKANITWNSLNKTASPLTKFSLPVL